MIALPVIPKRVKEEVDAAQAFYDLKERCIFCDIIRQETTAGVRLVTETDRFTVLEPYAPRFPFETWILPKRHESHFEDCGRSHATNLAWILRTTMRKIDKVLERPAYNFIVHSAPVQDGPLPHYHWHVEIIPKLTKVAGFEWGDGLLYQSDAARRIGQISAGSRTRIDGSTPVASCMVRSGIKRAAFLWRTRARVRPIPGTLTSA